MPYFDNNTIYDNVRWRLSEGTTDSKSTTIYIKLKLKNISWTGGGSVSISTNPSPQQAFQQKITTRIAVTEGTFAKNCYLYLNKVTEPGIGNSTTYLDSISTINNEKTYFNYYLFDNKKHVFGDHWKGSDAWGFINHNTHIPGSHCNKDQLSIAQYPIQITKRNVNYPEYNDIHTYVAESPGGFFKETNVPAIRTDWRLGTLTSVSEYKYSEYIPKLVHKKEFTYTNTAGLEDKTSKVLSLYISTYNAAASDYGYSRYWPNKYVYYLTPGKLLINTEREVWYENEDSVEITTHYQYEPLRVQPSRIICSNGKTTTLKYPYNFASSGNIFSKMTDRNIISPVVETIDSLKNHELSRTKTIYKLSGNNIVRDYIASSTRGNTTTNDVVFNTYNAKNYPTTITTRDNVAKTLTWDDFNRLKTETTGNLKNSYEYQFHAGMIKHTAPNSLSVNYAYNSSSGKLETIKNHSQETVNLFNYHYRPVTYTLGYSTNNPSMEWGIEGYTDENESTDSVLVRLENDNSNTEISLTFINVSSGKTYNIFANGCINADQYYYYTAPDSVFPSFSPESIKKIPAGLYRTDFEIKFLPTTNNATASGGTKVESEFDYSCFSTRSPQAVSNNGTFRFLCHSNIDIVDGPSSGYTAATIFNLKYTGPNQKSYTFMGY